MTRGRAGVKEVARLLERAARKHNESADATCSVAGCFDRADRELSDAMFERVFNAVSELARLALEGKPNYVRAARDLIRKGDRENRRRASRRVR